LYTIVVALVVTASGMIFFAVSSGPRRVIGRQVEAPVVAIADPASRSWVPLVAVSGEVREGFPVPVLSDSDELCFGFGREDFSDPTRPTLARCADRSGLAPLDRTDMRPSITVKAGLDDWWVIEFGVPIDDIEVKFVGGESLSADRVHLDGDVAVVRLPTEFPVAEVSWRSGALRVGCEPDEPEPGRFCDPSRRGSE
jgi:hypothetical protein